MFLVGNGEFSQFDKTSSGYGLHVSFLRARDPVASTSSRGTNDHIANLVEVRNIVEEHMFVQQKRKTGVIFGETHCVSGVFLVVAVVLVGLP